MRKEKVLKQLDSLIDNSKSFIVKDSDSIWQEDIKALKIAKKAISKEYRFKFLANTFLLIITIVIFGSLILLAHIVYR